MTDSLLFCVVGFLPFGVLLWSSSFCVFREIFEKLFLRQKFIKRSRGDVNWIENGLISLAKNSFKGGKHEVFTNFELMIGKRIFANSTFLLSLKPFV